MPVYEKKQELYRSMRRGQSSTQNSSGEIVSLVLRSQFLGPGTQYSLYKIEKEATSRRNLNDGKGEVRCIDEVKSF